MLMAVGAGEGGAREWSEPIQLTHHDGETMGANFEALMDRNGNIHLSYWLNSASGEHANGKACYIECDSNGNTLTGPIYLECEEVFPNLHEAQIALDDEGNVFVVGYYPLRNFYFMALDPNGNILIEPRLIESLTHPWWGDQLEVATDASALCRTSDGTFVYGYVGSTHYEGRDVFMITYTRLTAGGEAIDSVHVVKWFDRNNEDERGRPFAAFFTTDSEDNLNIVSKVRWRDTWKAHITKINRFDEVLYDDVVAPPFLDPCELSIPKDVDVDQNGNLYLSLIDIADSAFTHIQKYDTELELCFDFGLGKCSALSGMGVAAINGGIIGAINLRARYAEGGGNTFVSFDTSGNIIDSLERMPAGAGEQVFWFDNDFYSIDFIDTPRVVSGNLYLIRSLPLAVIQYPEKERQQIELSAYPNPFNATTRFTYDLLEDAQVSIRVFDLGGREVAALVNGDLKAGTHSVTWNAEGFTSGVYLIRMEAPSFSTIRKVTLVR